MILRKLTDRGIENYDLGTFYRTCNKYEHRTAFEEMYKEVFESEPPKGEDSTIGFVSSESGVFPIHKDGTRHYVMSKEGATLERLDKSMTKYRI